MTPHWHLPPNALIYALLIALPLSSLIARRVPVLRAFWSLVVWLAIFAVGVIVVTQRDKYDPFLSRLTAALQLDEQSVVGGEVRIRMADDGHFWARVSVDGTERRMLIDSGATVTALSSATARAAGLDVHDSLFPMVIKTANGAISAKVASVDRLRLGDISATDLPVVVSPAFGDTDVLGMNFLSKLKSWRVEGGTLVLTPHHPRSEA